MLTGKDMVPYRFPARLIAGVPLGAVFIGSTLIGLAPSASADAEPLVTLAPEQVTVESGETATMTMNVTGTLLDKVCLYGASADNGFSVKELGSDSTPANAKVSGTPKDDVSVTATVTYAAVERGTECGDVDRSERKTASSAAIPVVVTPTESPEEPTDEPTKEPTDEPTKEPTDEPTKEPTDEPTHEPTDGEGSDNGSGDGDGSSDDGSGDKGDGGSGATSDDGSSGKSDSSDTRSSASKRSDRAPDGGLPAPDLPSDSGGSGLPTDDAPLPPLDSSEPSDDLADLPTIEPGESDDSKGKDEAKNVAAEQQSPGASAITPAVLMLFLLLLLLLSAPLAPARRVRAGAVGYKGRRRRH